MLWWLSDPLVQSELSYQRYLTQKRPGRLGLLGRAVLWIVLTSSLILFWGEFITVLIHGEVGVVSESLLGPYVILALTTIVAHFGALLQTLALASNTIMREKGTSTWDILLMTDTDARRIVVSKWWATVSRMRHRYLMVGLMRAGLIISSIALLSYYDADLFGRSFHLNPRSILLSGAAIIALSLSNGGMTAAFGTAASLLDWRGGTRLIMTVVLRAVMLIVSGAILLFASLFVPYAVPLDGGLLLQYLGLTLIDNGGVLAMELANYAGQYSIGAITYPVCLLISLAVYVLLTLALLFLAQFLAVRQGALPPLGEN